MSLETQKQHPPTLMPVPDRVMQGLCRLRSMLSLHQGWRPAAAAVLRVFGALASTAAQARAAGDEERKVIIGLFNRYCIRCHGLDGRGVWDIPKVPDFTSTKWQASRSNAQLVRAILEGGKGTPEKRRDSLKLPPPSKKTGILHWAVRMEG